MSSNKDLYSSLVRLAVPLQAIEESDPGEHLLRLE